MMMPMVPTGLHPETFRQLPADRQREIFWTAEPEEKLRLLQACSDAAELLPSLPAQDLLLLIREVEEASLASFAPRVTAEQWTGIFDLDCWEKDRFSSDGARRWLKTFLAMTPSRTTDILLEMDFELLVLILSREVSVLRSPGDIEDEEERLQAMQRDGGYQLEFRNSEGGKLYGELLQRLFSQDPDFYRYLLNAVQSETSLLLEESVYQQRRGRLAELGFADPESASSIYAWLDPDVYRQERHEKIPLGLAQQGPSPAFALQVIGRTDLMSDLLEEADRGEIGWEIASLVNKVALAEQSDPGDRESLHQAGSRVMDTLRLALEWLSGEDAGQMRRLVQHCYCEDLFRLGVSLTIPLKRRARQLVSSTLEPYLAPDQNASLKAMTREPQAQFYADDVPQDGKRRVRPFRSRQDLDRAARQLSRMELLRELFEEKFPFALPDLAGLGEDAAAAEELSLSHFFLTALANQLLGRPFAPVPIPPAELPRLHELVCDGDRLRADLCAETSAWLEKILPGCAVFADAWLDLWAEEFCPIRPDHLDSRFISTVLIGDPS